MSYVDYGYYQALYGDQAIPEADFNRLSWDAMRRLDSATTGIDGIRKMKVAFPTDEDAAEAVRRCACALIDILYQIQQAENTARKASGYVETANGLQGKVISSVSAGNESVSYAVGSSTASKTWTDMVLSDRSAREKVMSDTIRDYLSGIQDANGVNLLYMGDYPLHRLNL